MKLRFRKDHHLYIHRFPTDHEVNFDQPNRACRLRIYAVQNTMSWVTLKHSLRQVYAQISPRPHRNRKGRSYNSISISWGYINRFSWSKRVELVYQAFTFDFTESGAFDRGV